MYVEDKCSITLTNCIFSSNKAITGKTLTVLKNSNVKMAVKSPDRNGTFTRLSQTSFNQTRLQHRKLESLAAEKLDISKRQTRLHLDQNSPGAITPTSHRLFSKTSSHPLKPAAVAKTIMSISRKSTPIARMLFNKLPWKLKSMHLIRLIT